MVNFRVRWDKDVIGLLQRVTQASVTVEGRSVGLIGAGLLVLVGIVPTDNEAAGRKLLERLLHYRIFHDEGGKMNRSLREVAGGLLLVPQFTLVADTSRGLRPGFSTAAPPALAEGLFAALLAHARMVHRPVAAGEFGAHMQVSLVNDGPATFWLES